MNDFLSDIYYSPENPYSFGGVEKLYTASEKAGKSYSRKSIQKWLEGEDSYTLFKQRRTRYPTRRTVARNVDEYHQCDLAQVSNVSEHNDGVTFLLCVVDVFSRFSFVRPLRTKTGPEVKTAFESIYSGPGARVPIALASDKGSEFLAKPVQMYFKKMGIHHFTLQNRNKAGICERYIKTLKSKIQKFMDARGDYRYIDTLEDFVSAYNAAPHSSVGMAPKDVSIENASTVYRNLYGREITEA